jgi:hypothetical protein
MPIKAKKETPLRIPPANNQIDHWIILGLDPSMSRTGYAVMEVRAANGTPEASQRVTNAEWLAAGSVKPDKIDDPAMHPRNTLWIRGKAMAVFLREFVKSAMPQHQGKANVGLIISMEYPTPMNDYLVALNRIIHLIFFEDGSLAELFSDIHVLTTNASTLRSLMRLTKKGNQNKSENIDRAYEFINRTEYPELDSDACDAVLLTMMARHTASILLGCSEELPTNFLNSLCNATQEIKGKGRNAHTITKGLLHRNEYWYPYISATRTVLVKDASNPKKKLERVGFVI